MTSPIADATLIGWAAEFEGIDLAIEAIIAAHPGIDCEDMPGYLDLDQRRFALLDLVTATKAMSLNGLRAKARVLASDDINGDFENASNLGISLAEDCLAILHEVGAIGGAA